MAWLVTTEERLSRYSKKVRIRLPVSIGFTQFSFVKCNIVQTFSIVFSFTSLVVHGATVKDVTPETLKTLLDDDSVLILEEVRTVLIPLIELMYVAKIKEVLQLT